MLVRTASQFNLLEDLSLLDPLLATDGWETLMTFTRESIREFGLKTSIIGIHECIAAARPLTPAPEMSSRVDQDIPQEIFDQIAAEEAATGAGVGAGGFGTGKVCPHCTFENDASRVDCDVCGLPL